MAKTSFQDVPDELRSLFSKSIEQRDRFTLGVVQGHRHLPSDRQRKALKKVANIQSPQRGRGSMFKFFSPMWRALDSGQKAVWNSAAAFSGLSGWQLFISDNAARARASLDFGIPPTDLWQVRTSRILIESPATGIKLGQGHPLDYVVTRKIRGKPWKEELVPIVEAFGLPLIIEIRYKSNLTPVGGSQLASFYAEVWSSYQGVDTMTLLEIPFAENADWTLGSETLSSVIGHIIGYTLYIEIVGYTGEIMFDNIRATHSGQNWARDPRCDNIARTFKKGFAQVLPFWIPLVQDAGATYSTQYPPAL